MSHVDDGRLHAYLDGTLPGGEEERRDVEVHLDACADCRARLAIAAKDRDGAQRILGVLSPEDVSMPPFEELMARRRARGAAESAAQGTASRLRRVVPLAWAASIAVALAGGWLARGALTSSPQRAAVAMTASGEDSLAAPSPEGEPQVDEPVESAPGEQQPQVTARDRAADPADSAGARAAPETALARPDSGSIALPVPPEPPEPVNPSRRAGPQTGRLEAARSALALEALEVPSGRAMDGVGQSVIDRLVQSERRATAVAAWTETSPAGAARRLGQPPVEIEGLPWVRMEIAEVDGEVLVRTVHPLPEGMRVELVQTPRTAAARARFRRTDFPDRPLVAGDVTGNGLVVVLSGLEDRDSLAELLERIR